MVYVIHITKDIHDIKKLAVRELNLIPIERLLNKYLSTGEGKRKRFQRTKEIQGSYVWKWGLG
jgi:hypothetical protein